MGQFGLRNLEATGDAVVRLVDWMSDPATDAAAAAFDDVIQAVAANGGNVANITAPRRFQWRSGVLRPSEKSWSVSIIDQSEIGRLPTGAAWYLAAGRRLGYDNLSHGTERWLRVLGLDPSGHYLGT